MLYLPKQIVERLSIKEGDVFLLKIINDNNLILRRVKKNSTKVEYWSEVTPGEVEEIGEEVSRKYLNNIVVDTTYLLPILGIAVRGLSREDYDYVLEEYQNILPNTPSRRA